LTTTSEDVSFSVGILVPTSLQAGGVSGLRVVLKSNRLPIRKVRFPMKVLRYLSIFAAVLVCQLPLQGEETPANTSLLPNGDFTTASTDSNWPADWDPDPAAPITWEAENGLHFIRMVATQPEMVIPLSQTITLPPDVKGVDLSIRFRVADFKFGANSSGGVSYIKDMHFNYQFLDEQGNRVPKGSGGFVLDSHAKDWTDVSRRVLVASGAAKLKVTVVLNKVAAGALDVAQVGVNVAPAAETEAMIQAIAAETKKAQDDAAEISKMLTLPSTTSAIKVVGNRLMTVNGTEVWLQGVNVCSLEWSEKGENILQSVKVAIHDWKANVIRLPVNDDFWFGRGKPPKTTSNNADVYRKVVDDVIQMAGARGAYVILDLHKYHAPNDATAEFWKDAATRYKDNPVVLFDIYNEPHGISWELWRNGGDVPVKARGNQPATSFHSPGMQGLVDAVRSTGAKNIIVAGGISYAYDLSGIMAGFALEDKTGNGIMYATHFYNWHKGWETHFLQLVDKYPLLVGEFGADVKKMSFIPAKNQEDPFTWAPDALALVQKYHLNWTAFSMHPKATPVLIKSWGYEPTPFWGTFVKDALSGKQFKLNKLR